MDKKEYRKLRFQWYRQVDIFKRSVKETCEIFVISRKTYYKWRKRDYGFLSNTYLSPVKRQPNLKLTEEACRIITNCKLKTNYGPLKMKLYLEKYHNINVSTTIIYRFYLRRRLIRRPQRKLPWYMPMKRALIITKAGEGVQLDTKHIWEDGIIKYLFSVLDPYTSKYFAKVFLTKESKNAIILHKEAENYFGFKILSTQTDNGSEFRGTYHRWLEGNSIPHHFIPKNSPLWNSKIERIHKTIDDEYFLNSDSPFQTIQEWLHFYNFERIHLSLNGLTPHEKYLESVTLDC